MCCYFCTDCILVIIAIFFPPFPVWVRRGICSADSIINIALCFLGYLPGLIHSWYIISKYPEDEYIEIDPESLLPGGHSRCHTHTVYVTVPSPRQQPVARPASAQPPAVQPSIVISPALPPSRPQPKLQQTTSTIESQTITTSNNANYGATEQGEQGPSTSRSLPPTYDDVMRDTFKN